MIPMRTSSGPDPEVFLPRFTKMSKRPEQKCREILIERKGYFKLPTTALI